MSGRVLKRSLPKILVLLSAFAGVARAADSRSAQDWDSVVKKGEDEGQVTVYASDSIGNAQIIWAAFQKRYPKIKFVGTSMGRGSDLIPKLFAERRAGKFLADVFLGAPSALYLNLYKAKIIEAIPPILVNPNVTDPSKWWMSKHHYVDPENQYIFMYESALYGPPIAFNTSLVNEKEIKSSWDLVQPKWKGKWASLQIGPSQGSTAMTYVYFHPQLGPKFIERVLRDMEPTMFRDFRQGTDWLAQGKIALCFLCRRIDRAAMQKLPVAELDPYQISEQPGIGSGSGALVLINQHPHPYGARVFVNWYLSQEGQTAFLQANTDELRVTSLREDIPADLVPAQARRRKDRDYLVINRPEWMDFKPIGNLIEELRKGK